MPPWMSSVIPGVDRASRGDHPRLWPAASGAIPKNAERSVALKEALFNLLLLFWGHPQRVLPVDLLQKVLASAGSTLAMEAIRAVSALRSRLSFLGFETVSSPSVDAVTSSFPPIRSSTTAGRSSVLRGTTSPSLVFLLPRAASF